MSVSKVRYKKSYFDLFAHLKCNVTVFLLGSTLLHFASKFLKRHKRQVMRQIVLHQTFTWPAGNEVTELLCFYITLARKS